MPIKPTVDALRPSHICGTGGHTRIYYTIYTHFIPYIMIHTMTAVICTLELLPDFSTKHNNYFLVINSIIIMFCLFTSSLLSWLS